MEIQGFISYNSWEITKKSSLIPFVLSRNRKKEDCVVFPDTFSMKKKPLKFFLFSVSDKANPWEGRGEEWVDFTVVYK